MSNVIILLGITLLFCLKFETINWYIMGQTIFVIVIYIGYDIYRKRKEG